MKVTASELPEVLEIEPRVFGDDRGFFFESFNRRAFRDATGLDIDFVQDNHSRSARNVLRGLHYQLQQAQGKLVRVVAGEIFDVAVDVRRSSPRFGRWMGRHLSADNKRMLWIPPGFAHGFLSLADATEVLYKATDYYAPEHERCVLWSDADIGVEWPLHGEPSISAKDLRGLALKAAELFA